MTFSYKEILKSYDLPVSVAIAKEHLQYVASSQSDELERTIKAVERYGENRMWRKIIQATCQAVADKFPSGKIIEIPRPPLISVESLKYIDRNGDLQTVASSEYDVDTISEPGRIVFKPDYNFPDIGEYANAVQINYTAGYALANIPPDIIAAIQMMTTAWFTNRSAFIVTQGSVTIEEVPSTSNQIFDMYSVRTP